LIYDTVADTSPTSSAATSLFADSVQFVENDDVQAALFTLLLVLFLCVCKQLSNVLFGLTDILVEYFRSVNDLGFLSFERSKSFPFQADRTIEYP